MDLDDVVISGLVISALEYIGPLGVGTNEIGNNLANMFQKKNTSIK